VSTKKFSLIQQLKSFRYAFNGLKILFFEEHNARIHFVVAVVVVLLSFLYNLNAYEWVAIILVISGVFIVEIINTAIENVADFVHPQYHPQIGKVKDIAASAVLISAIAAVMVGLIIFVPKL
jgi:diacylglycerol kinase (ATP)